MALPPDQIAELEVRLARYLAAEAAVLNNQEYELAGRKVVRADLREIRAAIENLRGQLNLAQGVMPRRGRVRRVVLR
jgi:hypothetical protein